MGEPVVVLLHGLARTHRSMDGMQRALETQGFRTLSLTYPSRRNDLRTLALDTAAKIRQLAPSSEYFAVTHSLGGILVRHMRDLLPWKRVVMIAPPNQGSAVARVFAKNPLYRWFYGPAGVEVSDSKSWPDPPEPFLVIAGTRGLSVENPTSWLTRTARVFPPDVPSDGTVAVEETKHPAMSAFREVHAAHTFIMNEPIVQELVGKFLRAEI
jgi:pimeloyl-ACP methyl ester carboxylesterase